MTEARDNGPAVKSVITHPEWGVYIGHAMGFGFFSLQDCVGQPCATVFENRQDAVDHIKSWSGDADPEGFDYVDVLCNDPESATPDEMAAAGIPESMLAPIRQTVKDRMDLDEAPAEVPQLN